MQWTQSGVSVALRRVCVEAVNWYFLQNDSGKKVGDDKKIYISGYLFMRWYKYVRRAHRACLSTKRTTVRQTETVKEDSKTSVGVKVFSSWDESDSVGGCCRWDTRNKLLLKAGRTNSGDIWEALWSARHFFLKCFCHVLMLEFSLQGKHAGDVSAADWQGRCGLCSFERKNGEQLQ